MTDKSGFSANASQEDGELLLQAENSNNNNDSSNDKRREHEIADDNNRALAEKVIADLTDIDVRLRLSDRAGRRRRRCGRRSRSLFVPRSDDDDEQTPVTMMWHAFKTYQAISSAHSRSSALGMLSTVGTAAAWLLRAYVGRDATIAGLSYGASADTSSKWLYFALGASLGIVIHNEVRWAFGERERCRAAKSRAFRLATRVLEDEKHRETAAAAAATAAAGEEAPKNQCDSPVGGLERQWETVNA